MTRAERILNSYGFKGSESKSNSRTYQNVLCPKIADALNVRVSLKLSVMDGTL